VLYQCGDQTFDPCFSPVAETTIYLTERKMAVTTLSCAVLISRLSVAIAASCCVAAFTRDTFVQVQTTPRPVRPHHRHARSFS